MVGDLLHGLDLHGDVEPVDDVGCRLRHSAGQPLQNFGAVRNHRHIAKAAISDSFKRVESAIADRMLSGATGGEIATTWFTPAAAATSGYDEFEVSRRGALGDANMSGIDADDEFFAPVPEKLHLELAPVIRLSPRLPCFPHDLVIEPFADPDGPLAHGRVGLGRFNRQELGQYLGRLPVGIMLPSRAVSSISSGVARLGQISCSGAKATSMPG